MYKKHGRDRETSLELQVKALVAKALEEQGMSMEPRILVTPLGELALVGSPPKVPSSQGSTTATTPIDRIREPTSCTLVFLSGRHSQRPAEHYDGGGNGCGTSSRWLTAQ